jgi:hypothetical protein
MNAGANAGSIGMSNVGFLLSFVDDASPHLKRVTSSYRQLSAAMDEAYKKGNQTGLFTSGLERIISGMEKFVEVGHQAVGLMASFSQLSRGKFGKVTVDVHLKRLPKLIPLAKGAIVNEPTMALIGEAGPEMVVPLGKKRNRDFWRWALPQLMPMAGGALPKITHMAGGALPTTHGAVGGGGGGIPRVFGGFGMGGEMEDLSTVMHGLQADYAEIESHISGIVDLTRKLRKQFGQTRSDMLQTRKVLTESFKGASYDIEDTFEAMFALRQESELTEQDAVKLSKTLGLVEDFTGTSLNKFAQDLTFYTEMSADNVNQLVLDLT